MTTSSINHRPAALVAGAVTGLVGALLAVAPNGAQAIPDRDARPPVVDRTVHANGHYVERACFIKPSLTIWSKADGPLPRCYTYVP